MLNSTLLNAMASRRDALKMFTMGGAAAAMPALTACAQDSGAPATSAPAAPPAAAPATPCAAARDNVELTINFQDPAQNLRSFIKVLGNLDPSVETMGWFGGDLFAVTSPDKPLQKMFGVEGMGVLRVEPQEDGSYRLFNRECAFYKHPFTGQYIDTWQNPFTGEEVQVSPIHNMVVNAEVAPVFKMDFDGEVQEMPFTPPWWVQEKINTAMSMFEVHVVAPNPMTVEEWPRESAGPMNRISEMFHRSVRLSELQDENTTSADYEGVWTRVGPWLPWMLQGQAEGHLLYRTFMTRPGTIDRMPDQLLQQVADKLGEEYFVAPPPETWGQQNDSSFSVYMEENEPAPMP
ncbi:MAG: DUF1838 family protein [Chromatiales bacterium]|nr:MAG: DUF1838 family protein [Chromatiales bacterium]